MTPERLAEIKALQHAPLGADFYLAIDDLLAERETLLADARRWKHVDSRAYRVEMNGNWFVEIWPHQEEPTFAAAVDQDIERTKHV